MTLNMVWVVPYIKIDCGSSILYHILKELLFFFFYFFVSYMYTIYDLIFSFIHDIEKVAVNKQYFSLLLFRLMYGRESVKDTKNRCIDCALAVCTMNSLIILYYVKGHCQIYSYRILLLGIPTGGKSKVKK